MRTSVVAYCRTGRGSTSRKERRTGPGTAGNPIKFLWAAHSSARRGSFRRNRVRRRVTRRCIGASPHNRGPVLSPLPGPVAGAWCGWKRSRRCGCAGPLPVPGEWRNSAPKPRTSKPRFSTHRASPAYRCGRPSPVRRGKLGGSMRGKMGVGISLVSGEWRMASGEFWRHAPSPWKGEVDAA